jgi:2-dehydropantoate 2-reductase
LPAGGYLVCGAGAIGATIAARLHLSGRDVVLVARGDQLEVLRTRGLTFQTPAGDQQLAIDTVAATAEADIAQGDIVLLTMKSQDTACAVRELARVANPGVAVVCAQNGVESEPIALRSFVQVYGMFVWVAAEHLEPGVVRVFAVPPSLGVLDLGRIPAGADKLAWTIASDLNTAGFVSRVDDRIMRWKYGKPVSTLGNVVEALLGPQAENERLVQAAENEALASYGAAGIEYASDAEISTQNGSP